MFLGFALDIHAHDDLNGTPLCRLTLSTTVGFGFRLPEVGFGMSDLQITIHSAHALATAANFHKHNLAKLVVLTSTGDVIPDPQPGAFLEEGDFAALSEAEQGGRMLTFKGPNPIYYLERMILRERGFTENPIVPRPEVRGGTNVDGMWTWGVGDHPWGSPGGSMVRVLEEGFYQPGAPLADATWDFDRDDDSVGTSWAEYDETWTAPIGSTGLDVLIMFLTSGSLYWRSDASLAFRAFKNDPGVDRSSATFAAGKVRFAAGVNIATEVRREIVGSIERKGVLVKGGDEVYEFVGGGPADVQWIGYIEGVRTRNVDRLHRIGERDLAARTAQRDVALTMRHIVGDDPTNGRYIPFVHYRPGDLVTLHTGVGAHDFNETPIVVAAIRIVHDEAGNWFGMPELGAQSLSADSKAFEERISRVIREAKAHSHPELLCDLTIACEDLAAADLIAGDADNGDAEDTGGGQWSGGAGYTTTFKHAGARSYGNTTGTVHDIVYTFDPAQVFLAGVRYILDVWGSHVGLSVSYEASFGVAGGDEEVGLLHDVETGVGVDGAEWIRNRICWTPTADRIGVRFRWQQTQSISGKFVLDDLALSTTDNNELAGTERRASRCDHGHHARDVPFSGSAAGLEADNVQGAIEEHVLDHPSGALEVAEADGSPDVVDVTRIEFDGPIVTDDGAGQVTVAAAALVHAHGAPAAGWRGVLVQRTTDFTALDSNDANPEFDTIHYDTDTLFDIGAPKILGPLPASFDGKMVRVLAFSGFESAASGFVELKAYKNVTPGSIGAGNDDNLVPGGVWQHTPNANNTFIGGPSASFVGAEGDTFVLAVKSRDGDDALAYEDVSILFGLEVVEPGEGEQGEPGEGVPVGGTIGQALIKSSGADFDTEWGDAATAPADDTAVWMPLTTVVGGEPELVWDGGDSLIPTLTSI